MIDITNTEYISDEERRVIVERSIYTLPYFYKMPFPVLTATSKDPLFSQRIGINRDFFLTEIMGNWGEVFTRTTSLFDITLYTSRQESVYRFDAGRKIPTGFVCQEARFNTAIAGEIYDDRQYEMPSRLIRNNDFIYGEVKNLTPKSADANATVVLKGYSLLKNSWINDREAEQINQSLAQPVKWEYFKINVDKEGRFPYRLSNDKFPRLILGMGVVNDVVDKAGVTTSTVQIKDLGRKLQLTDTPIPVEFLAPRLVCLRDTHLYYLPTEYYFQPFAELEFDITNTSPGETDTGYQLVILTRTV